MLDTGLTSSVFSGGYTQMASKGTNAGASPQGPRTATQAGFGTIAGGGSAAGTPALFGFITAGVASLALLTWIWWSLPR